MRIQDLKSGDVCWNQFEGKNAHDEKGWATVLANVPVHPLYPGLSLVIWHLAWEEGDRCWSFDALSPRMVIDYQSPYVQLSDEDKKNNFRQILKLQQKRETGQDI